MPAVEGIQVRGLRELNRAFSQASRDARKFVRAAEREIAEPVRRDAQELAVREISHIGTEWSQMRIGITQRLIYVAPKQRRKGGSPRTNVAVLLMNKAMQPALEKNRSRLETRIDHALDIVADNFNH